MLYLLPRPVRCSSIGPPFALLFVSSLPAALAESARERADTGVLSARLINTTGGRGTHRRLAEGRGGDTGEEGRRASLQIATPHCGVTPACYDTALASLEWCPQLLLLSPLSRFSMCMRHPCSTSVCGLPPLFPSHPPLRDSSSLLLFRFCSRCQPLFVPALHACKRGFTPITAMYLPDAGHKLVLFLFSHRLLNAFFLIVVPLIRYAVCSPVCSENFSIVYPR